MSAVDSLLFILVGFAVVMLALTLLWAVCALIGGLFSRLRPAPAARIPEPAQAASSASSIPPAHLAAISAAVAAVTGGKGRIVSVLAPAQVFTSWAQEGRTEQFSSHRVRWDWAVPGPPHVANDTPPHDD